MTLFKQFTTLAVATLFAGAAVGEPLLVDSFESGDMSATNADGFDWGINNRTSVVTADAAVYNNQIIENPIGSGQNWAPKDGDHSLRFRYAAGESMTEQRFDLGKAYEELWLQYWVRVPINYYHGQRSPSNHKFLALWMDGYSQKGDGASVIWEFWGSDDGSSRLAYHFSQGGYRITGEHIGHQEFINVPEDLGRWMEITIHVKASSMGSSPDGVIQLWRRWENELPSQRKLMHNQTDAILPLPASGPQGWKSGYFMGWANAPYAQDTEWLIDYITFSTESLLGTAALIGSASSAPNPPTLTLKN